jgi:hypothetical protein
MAICSIPTQGIPLLVSFGDAMNGEVFLRVAYVPTLVHVSVTQQRISYIGVLFATMNARIPTGLMLTASASQSTGPDPSGSAGTTGALRS